MQTCATASTARGSCDGELKKLPEAYNSSRKATGAITAYTRPRQHHSARSCDDVRGLPFQDAIKARKDAHVAIQRTVAESRPAEAPQTLPPRNSIANRPPSASTRRAPSLRPQTARPFGENSASPLDGGDSEMLLKAPSANHARPLSAMNRRPQQPTAAAPAAAAAAASRSTTSASKPTASPMAGVGTAPAARAPAVGAEPKPAHNIVPAARPTSVPNVRKHAPPASPMDGAADSTNGSNNNESAAKHGMSSAADAVETATLRCASEFRIPTGLFSVWPQNPNGLS